MNARDRTLLIAAIAVSAILIAAAQIRANKMRSALTALGVIIGILVVLMCAYSLVLDFDMVQRGVANQAPRKYEWTGAFSILVTVVWLYDKDQPADESDTEKLN